MTALYDFAFDSFLSFRLGNKAMIDKHCNYVQCHRSNPRTVEPKVYARTDLPDLRTMGIVRPVRICTISDTHERHTLLGNLPACDILIHAGDIFMTARKQSRYSLIQKLQGFNDWMKSQQAKYRIVVPGNHDALFELLTGEETRQFLPDCIYLCNNGIELCGLRVWGTPLSRGSSGNRAFQGEDFREHTLRSVVRKSFPDKSNDIIRKIREYDNEIETRTGDGIVPECRNRGIGMGKDEQGEMKESSVKCGGREGGGDHYRREIEERRIGRDDDERADILITHGTCGVVSGIVQPRFLHVWGHFHRMYGVRIDSATKRLQHHRQRRSSGEKDDRCTNTGSGGAGVGEEGMRGRHRQEIRGESGVGRRNSKLTSSRHEMDRDRDRERNCYTDRERERVVVGEVSDMPSGGVVRNEIDWEKEREREREKQEDDERIDGRAVWMSVCASIMDANYVPKHLPIVIDLFPS